MDDPELRYPVDEIGDAMGAIAEETSPALGFTPF
jgi:hypothetical protein